MQYKTDSKTVKIELFIASSGNNLLILKNIKTKQTTLVIISESDRIQIEHDFNITPTKSSYKTTI